MANPEPGACISWINSGRFGPDAAEESQAHVCGCSCMGVALREIPQSRGLLCKVCCLNSALDLCDKMKARDDFL